MTVRTGALIAGRYRVERQIGSGGMGVVWQAADETLGRTVAVKRAHPGADARRLRRLVREARLAGGVSHPHVVKLLDLVVEDAATWLVMEYIPSRNLAELLGTLSLADVARIGRQIAEALEAVHGSGIVHGDVTPGNILIADDGEAKLTDFGVARAVWGDETLSDSGLVHGTPAYLAPEVARGGETVRASDVFSLGATLFAAAHGVSPLGTGDNPLTVIWRSSSGHVATPTVPGPLAHALSAMLRVDPPDRPTATEAAHLLAEAATYVTGQPGDTTRHPASAPHPDTASADPPATVTAAPAAIPRPRNPLGDPTTPHADHPAEPQPPNSDPAVTVAVPPGGALPRTDPVGRRGVWVLAGVAVLAVAVSLLVFLPSDGRRPASVPAPVDPRDADPCALMSAMTLRGFGDTSLATDYGNFNRCDVLIEHSGDDLADVKVELENSPAPEAGPRDRVESRGRVRVVLEPAADDECDRTLISSDAFYVAVTSQRTGDGRIDLCAVATAVSSYAASVLGRGPIARRVSPPPATSLARLNACALLGESGRPGYGGWDCRGADARLRFDRNSPLDSRDGRPVRLAGHQAYVDPGGDGPGTCLVQVVHRTYTDVSDDEVSEIVYVVASGGCTRATSLASSAAAKLPPI